MQTPISRRLFTAAQAREIDRLAGAHAGLDGNTLMLRAGEAALRVLRETWPDARRIHVVCGSGNNGGDGLVLARLAKEAGLKPTAFLTEDETTPRSEAGLALRAAKSQNVILRPLSQLAFSDTDIVVDALFGTGLARDVTAPHAEAIQAVNASGKPALSLDIPSGLHADTGRVLGHAVRASVTVTFIGLKRGLFTADGPDASGRVVHADLDVPPALLEKVTPDGILMDLREKLEALPRRPQNAHKGLYGHVLVVGGDIGMPGAPRLAAEAALRSGAGLASIVTRPENLPITLSGRPELMGRGATGADDLADALKRATVVALGPGLGRSDWSREMWRAALNADKPLVIDADALNLLAESPLKRDDWILTPHPGEAARLLGCSTRDVQNDRFATARSIQARYGGIAVLKGAGTIVCFGPTEPFRVCPYGNPGMASGGTGDALTGVLAALVAQGLSLPRAAALGTCVHGRAGDLAAGDAARGIIAGDVILKIRDAVNSRQEK